MTIRFALLALASPFALAVAATPAAAQDDAADAMTTMDEATPEANADAYGDTVVVTAQLVEQSPIEVPFALTAYSGKTLDDLGITEFDKLSQFVPGFEVQNQSPNNPGFVMRGITSDDGAAYNEPRVTVFQDGVSISKARGSYVELFDMDRIEVAKGPQSTLYGRGALIGAVNLVQAKADPDDGYGYVYAEGGDYGRYRADMTVNIPLGSDIGFRTAARIKERDGYVDNLLGGEDYNGIKSAAVRTSLRVAPGPLTFDLIGNYQSDKASGTSFKSIAFNPTDPVTGAVLGNRGRNSGAALAPGAGFEGNRPLGLDREVWGVTGIANYDFGGNLSLNAIGSYRQFDNLEIFDADGISLPVITAAEDTHGEQTMGTLRLTYADEGQLTAFVGATYFNEKGYQRTPVQFDERVALAQLAGALNGLGLVIPGRPASDPLPLAAFGSTAFTGTLLQGVAGAYGVALSPAQAAAIAANLKSAHRETSTNFGETDSWDLFADATFNVTEAFQVGGGIRYTHDDKSTGFVSSVQNGRSILGGFIGALTQPAATRAALLGGLAVPGAANIPTSAGYPVPLFGLTFQPSGANGTRYEQDLGTDGLTWRAVARYALSPEASLYANYARGRRPELLSVGAPSTPGGTPSFKKIEAETVDSFEVGAKTELMNRALMLDGSVFYYKYNNFQTTIQEGTLFRTVNAGKAESYGFEGQFRYAPADWLSLFGTYAYNHSRFKNGIYDGNRFRLSPDHSASLGLALSAPVGPVKVDFTPTLTWQSKVYFNDDNDLRALQQPPRALVADNIQDEVQDSYALVDLRAGVETADGRWRIEGFVTNLLEQKYIKDAGNTGDSLGLPTFIAGEPRMIGAALSLRIGRR